MKEEIHQHKTLRQRDMVLFTVSAILLLDTLAALPVGHKHRALDDAVGADDRNL